MKYYVVQYDLNSNTPDYGKILWETESDSLTEAMSLCKRRPGFDYEVVSENDLIEEVSSSYDVPMLH